LENFNSHGTGPIIKRRQGIVKIPSFLLPTIGGHSLFGRSPEIISNGVRSNRTCTIQISNHLQVPLTDPQYYCLDGGLYYPLPPVIQPGTREVCVFSKDPVLSNGVIGVLSYRIGNTEERVSVMFAVPYNQLQYRNHFGTALSTGFECELAQIKERKHDAFEDEVTLLFDKMYSEREFYEKEGHVHSMANDGMDGKLAIATKGGFQIRGTMSDRGKSIIKLNVARN